MPAPRPVRQNPASGEVVRRANWGSMDCDWCGRRDDVAVLSIDETAIPSFQARLCSVCQVLLSVGPLASPSDTQVEWARGQVLRHLMRQGPASGVPSLRCSSCGMVIPLSLVQRDGAGERYLVCPRCRDRHVLTRRPTNC